MKPQRKPQPQPHAFAVSTVHEMPRPAEPAWLASTRWARADRPEHADVRLAALR